MSNLICIVCGKGMIISSYHDMSIVECQNCGFDDKDNSDILADRYRWTEYEKMIENEAKKLADWQEAIVMDKILGTNDADKLRESMMTVNDFKRSSS